MVLCGVVWCCCGLPAVLTLMPLFLLTSFFFFFKLIGQAIEYYKSTLKITQQQKDTVGAWLVDAHTLSSSSSSSSSSCCC